MVGVADAVQRRAEEEIAGRLGGDAAIALGVLAILLTVGTPTRTSASALIGASAVFALAIGAVLRFRPGRIPLGGMDALAVFSEVFLVLLGRYGSPVLPVLPGIYVVFGTILFSVRSTRVALTHFAAFGASYAGVLVFGPQESAPVTRWIGVMAAVLVSGTFVRWLVELGSKLAIAEAEARAIAERAGAALEAESDAKSRFIARMSHELRTPLNVVLGFADLLNDPVAGPLNERQTSYVDDIAAAARHLAGLVGDVLRFTSADSSPIDLRTHDVEIAVVLDDAARLVREQAGALGVALVIEPVPDATTVVADARKIRQVLVNLLANAVRFTPPGGTVTATTQVFADGVRIDVRDEGSGIPPEDRDHIFEPFATTASEKEGTGLGLPLSRRIIEAHGGRLTLVESALGIGSTFAFELPSEPRAADSNAAEPLPDPAAADPSYAAFTEPGSAANRQLIVRVGTWFAWVSAAIQVAVAITTPLPARTRLIILGIAAGNTVSAAALRRMQDRIRLIGIDVWGAAGTVLISVGVYYSQSFITITPLAYGWAPMVAFALWGKWRAMIHVGIVGACFAAVLTIRHDLASPVLLWLTIMTLISFNGAVVRWLTDRLRNLISTEQLARRNAERMRGELAAAAAHKSDFLASTSHELRTPLNAIVGFADLLRGELAGPLDERQQAYVDDIRTAARRLQSVIDDVLDLAKIEAGRLHIDPELVAIRPMLERIALLAQRAGDGVLVDVDVDPDAEFVTADVHRLEQVLTNLAVNGVKFTPVGGRVSLAAHRTDAAVQLVVADTGIGIGADQHDQIFEPFHQGSRMLGGKLPEGTGLGLSLAKSLVEMHGGRIEVRSEPNRGAVFTVELPISESDTLPTMAAPSGIGGAAS
ncbi:MAG TPA: HAMP domain-containing sensor histidine kinase [Mycobacteriales bacterium]|nr:HAMP domain-containing sensor histidine kinase [Mycobacteriales bacterium]